jgi:hypothetical protein
MDELFEAEELFVDIWAYFPENYTREFIMKFKVRLFYLCVLSFILALVLREQAKKHEYVCIIGNAETAMDAYKMHQQWLDRFPSVWVQWGNDTETLKTSSRRFHLLHSDRTVSWAQGIFMAYSEIQKRYRCEYFFTHDDDLDFYSKSDESLPDTLLASLKQYHPAVVSFPYDYVIRHSTNLRDINSHFSNSSVSPMLVFDSGMILYHASVVDFFIPYSPR